MSCHSLVYSGCPLHCHMLGHVMTETWCSWGVVSPTFRALAGSWSGYRGCRCVGTGVLGLWTLLPKSSHPIPGGHTAVQRVTLICAIQSGHCWTTQPPWSVVHVGASSQAPHVVVYLCTQKCHTYNTIHYTHHMKILYAQHTSHIGTHMDRYTTHTTHRHTNRNTVTHRYT